MEEEAEESGPRGVMREMWEGGDEEKGGREEEAMLEEVGKEDQNRPWRHYR